MSGLPIRGWAAGEVARLREPAFEPYLGLPDPKTSPQWMTQCPGLSKPCLPSVGQLAFKAGAPIDSRVSRVAPRVVDTNVALHGQINATAASSGSLHVSLDKAKGLAQLLESRLNQALLDQRLHPDQPTTLAEMFDHFGVKSARELQAKQLAAQDLAPFGLGNPDQVVAAFEPEGWRMHSAAKKVAADLLDGKLHQNSSVAALLKEGQVSNFYELELKMAQTFSTQRLEDFVGSHSHLAQQQRIDAVKPDVAKVIGGLGNDLNLLAEATHSNAANLVKLGLTDVLASRAKASADIRFMSLFNATSGEYRLRYLQDALKKNFGGEASAEARRNHPLNDPDVRVYIQEHLSPEDWAAFIKQYEAVR